MTIKNGENASVINHFYCWWEIDCWKIKETSLFTETSKFILEKMKVKSLDGPAINSPSIRFSKPQILLFAQFFIILYSLKYSMRINLWFLDFNTKNLLDRDRQKVALTITKIGNNNKG